MTAYVIRRLLMMIPTIFGIMLVSFTIVQFAPGGPIERIIAQIQGTDVSATTAISGSAGGDFGSTAQQAYRGDTSVNSKGPRAWIPNSSRNWRRSSASTSRPTNVSF